MPRPHASRRPAARRRSSAAVVPLLSIGVVAAQPVPQQPGAPRLQRVDPAVGDVGPLGISTRNLGVDLRVPSGFGDVYRLNGSNTRSDSGLFVRADGGVFAVFPRSVYRSTQQGDVPEVAPGTVFYIGGLPASLAGSSSSGPSLPSSPYYMSTQASTRVGEFPRMTPKPAPLSQGSLGTTAPPPGVFTSEPVRVRLVHELLAKAADEAARSRPAPP